MTAKSPPSKPIQRRGQLLADAIPSGARPPRSDSDTLDSELIQEFGWQILSIHNKLEDIRAVWAAALSITRPQWMILTAIHYLDKGNGIPVKDISARLHVDPSFVTTQSKILEKQGLIRRVPSREDARVVLMSLTDRALKQQATLHAQRAAADNLVFSDFTDRSFQDLNARLALIRDRLARAAQIIAADTR